MNKCAWLIQLLACCWCGCLLPARTCSAAADGSNQEASTDDRRPSDPAIEEFACSVPLKPDELFRTDEKTIDASNWNATIIATSNSMLGEVQVLQWENQAQSWEQLGNTLEGMKKTDWGEDIALSDDGLVLAVALSDETQVYHLVDNSWVQLGNSMLGPTRALALSGDGLTCALLLQATYNLEVYQWEPEVDSWTLQGTKVLVGDEGGSGFHLSLSLSEDGSMVSFEKLTYSFSNGDFTELGHPFHELDCGASTATFSSDGARVAVIGSDYAVDGDFRALIYVYELDEETMTWSSLGQVLNKDNTWDWNDESSFVEIAGDTLVVATPDMITPPFKFVNIFRLREEEGANHNGKIWVEIETDISTLLVAGDGLYAEVWDLHLSKDGRTVTFESRHDGVGTPKALHITEDKCEALQQSKPAVAGKQSMSVLWWAVAVFGAGGVLFVFKRPKIGFPRHHGSEVAQHLEEFRGYHELELTEPMEEPASKTDATISHT